MVDASQKSQSRLDRVSTGSGSDLVTHGSQMPITDQVATAPCTDPIQARRPTFKTNLRQHR